jgi:hypothetical protein
MKKIIVVNYPEGADEAVVRADADKIAMFPAVESVTILDKKDTD